SERSLLGEYQPHTRVNGKRVPLGEPVKGYFPTVIPEAEWYRVRAAIKGRGKDVGPTGVGVASLFTGLIRDARDGQTMHLVYSCGSANKGNTRALVSYGCRIGEPGSVHMAFPYDAVERAFLATVAELKAADILRAKTDGAEAELASLSAQLDEVEGKIAAVQS